MTFNYQYYPTYLDFYDANISKPLAAIDCFIKSEQAFSIEVVSELLRISAQEVSELLRKKRIKHWDTHAFLNIMVSGSSHVCQFYKREVETGYLERYSAKDIAYIYNLEQCVVREIFEQLNVCWVSGEDVARVLSKVSVCS